MHPSPAPLALCFSGPTGCGGAAGVLAWSLHALQQDYRLSVYTFEVCKHENWNSVYGTRLQPERISWHSFECAHPRWFNYMKAMDLSTLNQYALMKWAGSSMGKDSIPFSVHNEMAFPAPGLQYIHFPMLMTGRRDLSKQIGQPGTRVKDLFGSFCRWLFRIRQQDLSRNMSLCNSAYIEQIFKEYYGAGTSTRVLYPPCAMEDAHALPPWPSREDAIVCMGRAVPHKRLEDAIAIRALCERKGLSLTLHIVTPGGDPDYLNGLQTDTRGESRVVWHFNLTRNALQSLMTRSKYGLHCNPGEHFGMSTAELAGAGCLVFGHDSGGTREILPSDTLRFKTPEEAAAHIVDVHRDPAFRESMLAELAGKTEQFSSETFCHKLREEIRRFLDQPLLK